MIVLSSSKPNTKSVTAYIIIFEATVAIWLKNKYNLSVKFFIEDKSVLSKLMKVFSMHSLELVLFGFELFRNELQSNTGKMVY